MENFFQNLDPIFLAVFLSISTFFSLIFLVVALVMKKIGGKINKTIDQTMENAPALFKEKLQIHDPLNLNFIGNIFIGVTAALLSPLLIYAYFRFIG